MCVIYFVIFFCSTSSSSSLRSFSDRFFLLLSLSMRFLSLHPRACCWSDCVDFACCRLAIDMLHVCERRAFQTFHLSYVVDSTSKVYCCPIYSRLEVSIVLPLIRRKISRMHFYILRISKCIAFSKLENRFDQSVSFRFFSFLFSLHCYCCGAGVGCYYDSALTFVVFCWTVFFVIIIIDRAPIFTVNRSLFNLFVKNVNFNKKKL